MVSDLRSEVANIQDYVGLEQTPQEDLEQEVLDMENLMEEQAEEENE